jgi:hypothetical protein
LRVVTTKAGIYELFPAIFAKRRIPPDSGKERWR